MRSAAWLALAAWSCASPIPPDGFCREVGYAIAAVTQRCTGSVSEARERFEAFEQDLTCREWTAEGWDTAPVLPEDLYHCPLAIRALSCEKVDEYGADLDRYLEASPVCSYLLEDT
jgi:hypothetical protein